MYVIPKLSSAIPIYYNYIALDRKQLNVDTPSDYQDADARVSTKGKVSVSATLTNTGSVAGKQVVQVYLSKFAPLIERPLKNLVRFEKVRLEPGESRSVTFEIQTEEMGYYLNEKKQVDKDTYTLYIGSSSADEDLEQLSVTFV
ncbi:hypothetical protein N7517_011595 [Penicillium concentricum]|uniref:beta-glucosidase n=1 Tax=Penicillium concentricum TaxID=293559 RepID=A0A9W9RB78_9EURO|nr:uncharacterized protein N7517_011595 [Penicillium concentricum]KAJ5356986.1 hypothetical protein N7517_011595 [Penicillium concentricum]